MAHSIAQVGPSPQSKSQSQTHTKQPSLRIIITTPQQPSNANEDTFPWTDIPRPTVGEANKRPEYIMWGMFQSRTNEWFCTMYYICFFAMVALVGVLVGFAATRDMTLVYYMVATAYGAIMWTVATVCARRHLHQQVEHLTEYVESVMDQPGRMSVSSDSSVAVVGVIGGQDEFRL